MDEKEQTQGFSKGKIGNHAKAYEETTEAEEEKEVNTEIIHGYKEEWIAESLAP